MNKTFLLNLLVMMVIVLSGCTMNEIEEYSIVAGIGIDFEDDKYIVTYEIYKENNGQTTSLTSIIKSDEGKSISDAVNNIENKIYQTPYLNHCLLIILGKNLINEKLDKAMNYFIHDVRIRSSCFIVATENKSAKEILENSQKINQVISYNIYKKLDQNPIQASVWNKSHFNYIMNEKVDDNGVVIIPIVKYNEDFDLSNAYIIRDDNTIYKTNNIEVFVFQLFYNVKSEGLINIDGTYVYLKSINSKIKKNNKMFNLDVYMQILSYDDLKIDLNDVEEKAKLIKELQEKMKLIIEKTFKKFQNYLVDPFAIYKYMQRYDPITYQKIEKDYYNYFKEIKIEISIKIDLLTSGLSEERI